MHHQERRQKCQNSHGAALSFIAICIALLMRNALDPFRLKNRGAGWAKFRWISGTEKTDGRPALSLAVRDRLRVGRRGCPSVAAPAVWRWLLVVCWPPGVVGAYI